eukprot:763607-Hanusia_phi.AAC.2
MILKAQSWRARPLRRVPATCQAESAVGTVRYSNGLGTQTLLANQGRSDRTRSPVPGCEAIWTQFVDLEGGFREAGGLSSQIIRVNGPGGTREGTPGGGGGLHAGSAVCGSQHETHDYKGNKLESLLSLEVTGRSGGSLGSPELVQLRAGPGCTAGRAQGDDPRQLQCDGATRSLRSTSEYSNWRRRGRNVNLKPVPRGHPAFVDSNPGD